jgi:hypothetical protein
MGPNARLSMEKARPTSLFQVFFSTNILVNKECHSLDKSMISLLNQVWHPKRLS